MTGDWGISPGVMAACAISYLVHGSLSRDSMYTVRLTRRGIVIVRGSEVRPTERIAVASAMVPVAATVRKGEPAETALRRLMEDDHETLMVLDDDQRLVGVVSLSDLRRVPPGALSRTPVEEVACTGVVTVVPDDSLERAMRRFAVYDFNMLPVVARDDPRRVVGRLRRSDVLRAYHVYTMHTLETSVRIDFLRESHGDQGAFREAVVVEGSPAAGRCLAELALPAECVVVTVRRGAEVLVPHGSTRLQPGDRVLVFAVPSRKADAVAAWISAAGLPAAFRAARLWLPGGQQDSLC